MRSSVSPLVLAFNLAAFAPGGVGKPAHPGGSDSDQVVFDPAPVLHLRIELPREAVQQLRTSPRTFVRGTVHEGDQVYTEVGVHLKGSVGSFRQIGDKPGLSLKFDEFVKKQ